VLVRITLISPGRKGPTAGPNAEQRREKETGERRARTVRRRGDGGRVRDWAERGQRSNAKHEVLWAKY
jgi:hypothetical protein